MVCCGVGTPAQNNLDELYAVVNFAAPGYLGTLKEFQVGGGKRGGEGRERGGCLTVTVGTGGLRGSHLRRNSSGVFTSRSRQGKYHSV